MSNFVPRNKLSWCVMAGDFPAISAFTVSQWPETNSINPTTRGWYPPYTVTLTSASVVILATRLWPHAKRRPHDFGLDDLVCGLAGAFALLFSAMTIAGTLKYGFDRHMWDVPPRLHNSAALIAWLSQGAFIISTSLTKISVLLFFRRLEHCTKGLRNIIYAFIGCTVAFTISCLLTEMLLCRPTADYWRIPDFNHLSERSCASQHTYYPLQGFFETLSTFYSILIPVLVLRNLPMSQFQRQGLRVISLGGLIVLGAGIARTVFLSRLVDSDNGDATWNTLPVFICSQLECSLSLICASIPSLQPYGPRYPGLPVVHTEPTNGLRKESVVSRVSSSLSGQIQRLPLGRSSSPRNLEISRPQAVEIPNWEFAAIQSPRAAHSPADEHTYDRYLAGMYGPPAPPKDSRHLFDEYRRERHGEIV
ncbi:hypothetical protein K491DRAFT_780614 [Lophiostoma macrostomum CBS 122681]|uniref:Rhodopsin domain-containing protein n=1 Tax=Lophiostoma macrostomum CBS 122681 TaxID=1314788 RepID=A0A6A6SZ90_9PLEO|nr:hypothetical protein K491DRAFT_780614 [Lophiostoma macrostomum CBS 122681]